MFCFLTLEDALDVHSFCLGDICFIEICAAIYVFLCTFNENVMILDKYGG